MTDEQKDQHHQAFEQAESDYAKLDREKKEAVFALIEQYRQIMRSVGRQQDHSVRQPTIDRLSELRELERTLKATEQANETSKPFDFSVHEGFSNEARIPPEDLQTFKKAIEAFKKIRESLTDQGKQAAFDHFALRMAARFNQRQETILASRDQASVITALRGATFELSRITMVMRQNLEQIDFDAQTEGISLDFRGYPKKGAKFSEPPTHEIKNSAIDFDVPIIRDGKPYIYETKCYPRKHYGQDIQNRNQALKYKAAIDRGLASGATIEVAGRINLDFLAWAMGTRIDEPGAIPEVEIVYNIPLPSGKEYRFVLKRGLQRNDVPGGIVTNDIGLYFHNEGHYDEADQNVISGIEKSIADKSIIQIISSTNISTEAVEAARDDFLSGVDCSTSEDFRNAFAKLLGLNVNEPESFDRILRGFFGDKKKKKFPEGQDRFYTDEVLAEKLEEMLGYKIVGKHQQALNDIWAVMFEDPSKVTSAAVYEIYNRLREEAVRAVFEKKKEESLINRKNAKSAVSEYATAEYVESSLRAFLDYLEKNPDIAAVKRHYIIPEERIPEATERTMSMLEKIAEYERARTESLDEAERIGKRREMGYTGKSEGVALDIEHVLTDVLYGMNKEGMERDRIVNQIFGGNETWREFFDEGSDPSKVYSRFRTEEELDKILSTNKTAQSIYEGLGKRCKTELRKVAKEGAFVRSYDWPERFMEASQLVGWMEDQDRRYQEIHVFDPKDTADGKTLKHADTDDKEIARTEINIIRENIARAKAFMNETGRDNSHKRPITELEGKITAMEKERDEKISGAQVEAKRQAQAIGLQQKELRDQKQVLEKKLKTIEDSESTAIETQIEALEQQSNVLNETRAQAFGEVQAISAEYQPKLKQLNVELEGLYQQAVPKQAWEKLAKRIVHRMDQNIMKVTYAVTPDEEIVVQEEVIRGDVSGRAAHSELAQGHNVYGAGELAFEKRDGKWILIEINNGSGHYRPDADSNLFYVKRLLAEKGIDTENAEVVDCILRGRKLREVSLF